jgi:hypothetical protein
MVVTTRSCAAWTACHKPCLLTTRELRSDYAATAPVQVDPSPKLARRWVRRRRRRLRVLRRRDDGRGRGFELDRGGDVIQHRREQALARPET